jgi:hypothetical protein
METLRPSPPKAAFNQPKINETLNMKRLPILAQSFPKLIAGDYLYADKTEYIHKLLDDDSNQFFLSRPRRFGKTLLLDTIRSLFTGNDECFKDLWIGKSKYAFPRHPVINLNLSLMDSDYPQALKDDLLSMLIEIAKKENLNITNNSLNLFFKSLICGLSDKYKSGVVVLIDEYDYPVAGRIGDMDPAPDNSDILGHFFMTPKDPDVMPHARLALIIGITGFSLTSFVDLR